jgi:hypothetical protein
MLAIFYIKNTIAANHYFSLYVGGLLHLDFKRFIFYSWDNLRVGINRATKCIIWAPSNSGAEWALIKKIMISKNIIWALQSLYFCIEVTVQLYHSYICLF